MVGGLRRESEMVIESEGQCPTEGRDLRKSG